MGSAFWWRAKKGTLKLYDLSFSSVPVAKFAIPGVEWKAVGFVEPDRMVGETTTGQFYAWPVFKDRDALIKFAEIYTCRSTKKEKQ